MFIVLAIVGNAVVIPTVLLGANASFTSGASFFTRLTPNIRMDRHSGHTWLAYLFDAVIFYFLWANYRHILRLRRAYLRATSTSEVCILVLCSLRTFHRSSVRRGHCEDYR